MSLFSLEKRSLGEDQSVFQHLQGIYGKDGWKEVFSRLLAGRIKGCWKKLLQGKFCLDASRKRKYKKCPKHCGEIETLEQTVQKSDGLSVFMA